MALQMRNPTTAESTYPFPRHFGLQVWLKRLPRRIAQTISSVWRRT